MARESCLKDWIATQCFVFVLDTTSFLGLTTFLIWKLRSISNPIQNDDRGSGNEVDFILYVLLLFFLGYHCN